VVATHGALRSAASASLICRISLQHRNLLFETAAEVVDLGGRRCLVFGVLGRDMLHDPTPSLR